MRMRSTILIVFTITLVMAIGFSLAQVVRVDATSSQRLAALQNVRAYLPAATADGLSYVIDGGSLLAGEHGNWVQVPVPAGVVAGAVAVDTPANQSEEPILYMGAANQLAVYRSPDGGRHWQEIRLTREQVGGVTAMAFDAAQGLLYVGTDTAGIFSMQASDSHLVVQEQWPLESRILQIATDGEGANLVLARTDWALLRLDPEQGGRWLTVENLERTPTSMAIVKTQPATLYVGTMDRGILRSGDGATWVPFNAGLHMGGDAQLRIDALAADPAQPGLLYVATSYLSGSREQQTIPAEVAYLNPNDTTWMPLETAISDRLHQDADGITPTVTELLPVNGETGSVYALTSQSRSPMALGSALPVETLVQQLADADTGSNSGPGIWATTAVWGWLIAGLAGLALLYSVVSDLRRAAPTASSVPQQSVK